MGLQCSQVSCPGTATTTVTGRVTAPNGLDPVYDAAVYVPATIPEFPATVQCEVCNEPLGGQPIVSTNTDVNGNFTLTNVPVTTQVPIIIQKGRFRRILHIDINGCMANSAHRRSGAPPQEQERGRSAQDGGRRR